MQPLSLRESREILEHLARGIEDEGLMRLLGSFRSKGSKRAAQAMKSWSRLLEEGRSFPVSLALMEPRFPAILELILQRSIQEGWLDRALRDVLGLYGSAQEDRELEGELLRRWGSSQTSLPSEDLCSECALRDLSQILRRALLEGAGRVILSQEGEEFFDQTYLGAKPVRYREPCHSKVHAALRKILASRAEEGRIRLDQRDWSARRNPDGAFALQCEGHRVVVAFRDWTGSPVARIEPVQADITTLTVDAIVNAANEGMLGGGGVDGAIHRAAGPELLEACRAVPEVSPGVRCPTGEARITPGFRLPARLVIHTVGPVWSGGEAGETELLARCYRSCLAGATRHGVRLLAFPAVSCGVFGFPREEAAAVAVREIRRCLARGGSLERVLLVAFDGGMLDVLRRAVGPQPDGGWS